MRAGGFMMADACSFAETTDLPGATDADGNIIDVSTETDPWTYIGQYPALARMIYRGDVTEGPIISIRKVSDHNLQTGTFDFKEDLNQHGDIKDFNGTVPQQALAAGRVVVQFTAHDEPSTFPDMTQYLKDKVTWVCT